MFEFIFDYIDEDKYRKYFRVFLVVIVYVLFRGYYSEWAKQKQVKRQLEIDEQEKLEKPERDRKEAEEHREKLEKEAKLMGWGKLTRAKAKRNEAILQEAVSQLRERNQLAYDAAEDNDIEDLLED